MSTQQDTRIHVRSLTRSLVPALIQLHQRGRHLQVARVQHHPAAGLAAMALASAARLAPVNPAPTALWRGAGRPDRPRPDFVKLRPRPWRSVPSPLITSSNSLRQIPNAAQIAGPPRSPSAGQIKLQRCKSPRAGWLNVGAASCCVCVWFGFRVGRGAPPKSPLGGKGVDGLVSRGSAELRFRPSRVSDSSIASRGLVLRRPRKGARQGDLEDRTVGQRAVGAPIAQGCPKRRNPAPHRGALNEPFGRAGRFPLRAPSPVHRAKSSARPCSG